MASFFDKVKIAVAAPKKSKFSLQAQHITTADFFGLQPVFSRELIPNEEFNFSMHSMARLAAMPVPSYCNVRLNQRAFFVPFKLVFPGWDDFITDTPHVFSNNLTTGLLTHVPTVSNMNLVSALLNSNYNYVDNITQEVLDAIQQSVDPPVHDFKTSSGSSAPFTTGYYRLTTEGRQLYKILRSLGYQLNFNIESGSVGASQQFSALPLLCYVKVFLDWYYPAQYYGDSDRMFAEAIFKQDTSLNPSLTYADVNKLYTFLGTIPYDQDYFTAAFDNPVGPNTGNFSPVAISDISNVNSAGSTYQNEVAITNSSNYAPNDGTPALHRNGSPQNTLGSYINQYLLDALKKLTDYSVRHQLVGARSVQRFLARYGVNLPDADRSIYISGSSVPLMVNDVMATAETSQINAYVKPGGSTQYDAVGTNLGDYAGKGVIKADQNFTCSFTANDFGMFIVMTSIVPRVGYYQGYKRNILHINKLDFFTPEFDGLGNRLIQKGELFVPLDADTFDPTEGFGFQSQYSEYKDASQHENLTGDFVVPHVNAAGFVSESWHTFRQFSASDESNLVHSKSFITGVDRDQYMRIFYNTNDNADHFVCNHLFDCTSLMPAKPLYDTYDFEDEDNKKIIEMTVNGERLN